MEVVLPPKAPSLKQQLFDSAIRDIFLTTPQQELLAKFINGQTELDSLSIEAQRHPQLQGHLSSALKAQQAIADQIQKQPSLEKAKERYLQLTEDAAKENEP